uniref:Uncharacterized protein n=1 Tax=Ascaris lumbricoides TaxID=6252 RepID=A0A0M3ILD5_ASCLU
MALHSPHCCVPRNDLERNNALMVISTARRYHLLSPASFHQPISRGLLNGTI